MKKNNEKKPSLLDEAQSLEKRMQEQLRISKQRLEETKRLLEETNRQFFSQETNEVSVDRLKKLKCEVSVYDNQSRYFALSKRRINNIPKRDIEWFSRKYSLMAYTTDGKDLVWIKTLFAEKHEAVLYQLQAKGYRFIENTNEAFLSVAKDCQTCRFASQCPSTVKTAVKCPATWKIPNGDVLYSIAPPAFDELVKVNCKN